MEYGIKLDISNSLRKQIHVSGNCELSTGTTTIEAESSSNGQRVIFYVQIKGFGHSSSKSVRTVIDNDTAEELIVFLKRHIDLSAKADAMLKAGNDHAIREGANHAE